MDTWKSIHSLTKGEYIFDSKFIPNMVKDTYSLTTDFYKFLENKCHEETKKAFYKTKKGEELKVISEAKEEAIDLLHSDMIGSEVLRHISAIAKKSQIAISIPQDVKQLSA